MKLQIISQNQKHDKYTGYAIIQDNNIVPLYEGQIITVYNNIIDCRNLNLSGANILLEGKIYFCNNRKSFMVGDESLSDIMLNNIHGYSVIKVKD